MFALHSGLLGLLLLDILYGASMMDFSLQKCLMMNKRRLSGAAQFDSLTPNLMFTFESLAELRTSQT